MFRDPLEIHPLNVQPSFPGTIRGVCQLALEEDQRQELDALAATRKLFDDAAMHYVHHISVCETPETIVRYVDDKRIDQVVMGTRCLGSIIGMFMGSVATKVLHLVKVPVLLVPQTTTP